MTILWVMESGLPEAGRAFRSFLNSPFDSTEEKKTGDLVEVSQLLGRLWQGFLCSAFFSFYLLTAFGQIEEIQANCLGKGRDQIDWSS